MKRKTSPRSAVFDAVAAFNAGREPERLAMKFAKMAQNPFLFLRGACHLFYAALPDSRILRDAPPAWCCGDAHFENFGSYKGNNRQVYFDINDYDEAALAPATWDIVRLLTSIQCGAATLKATRAEALAVCRSCVQAYRGALIEGKPLWIERETSVGLVNDLLSELRERERAAFLDQRTIRKDRGRKLRVDGVKTLPISAAQRKTVTAFMHRFAATQPNTKFFRVLDIGRRIAGTGSLGLVRFVLLVRGNGSPDGNYLLELKQSRSSALVPHLRRLGIKQPQWPDEAARIVAIQKRMQSVDHAFLHAVKLAGLPCILKELQPSEDRIAIGNWGGKLSRLKNAAGAMGRVLAWDQLRGCGRSGSASADELIAFAQRRGYVRLLLEAAAEMTLVTQEQWQSFAAAVRGSIPKNHL